jgi:uncharacterized protein YprB with RNaseH-like and TPR domain
MNCPHCNSDNIYLKEKKNFRYKCKDCKKRFTNRQEITPSKLHTAKVLLFDIETLPIEAYIWSLKQDGYISPESIKHDWCVLSWSAKWLYEPNMMSDVLFPEEALQRNDERIVRSMWQLLNEADIVISHNGVRFDHKKLNTRYIIHGINPPMYYRTIDTLQVARQNFAFSSNKLDYINKSLGIHQKSETDYSLWKYCAAGDIDALLKMVQYNENDVLILEELYTKFRPWISNHPSLKMFVSGEGNVCANCASTNLKIGGKYRTQVNTYTAYRCKDCGAIGRSRKKD